MQAERGQELCEHRCLELREELVGGHWATELAARQDSPGALGTDPRPGHCGPFIKDAQGPECSISLHHPALSLPRFTASVWSLPHQAKPLLLKPGPRQQG